MVEYGIVKTAAGAFGFVTRRHRLVATYLPQPKARIRQAIKKDWPEAVESAESLPAFRRQVVAYYAGESTRLDIGLDLSDLPSFRKTVLEACRRIPYGRTTSYAELARAVGRPRAARAVGGAMANNPLPLVIPCHRVLRSDGSLGGFSSPDGVKQKEQMLRLERGRPKRTAGLARSCDRRES